jgi:hypothetical protein
LGKKHQHSKGGDLSKPWIRKHIDSADPLFETGMQSRHRILLARLEVLSIQRAYAQDCTGSALQINLKQSRGGRVDGHTTNALHCHVVFECSRYYGYVLKHTFKSLTTPLAVPPLGNLCIHMTGEVSYDVQSTLRALST